MTIFVDNPDFVRLYDSLGSVLTRSLQKQIAAIAFNQRSSTVTVERQTVQRQGVNDCGVLAIAFAMSLANGRDPAMITYSPAALRSHLRQCLMSGVFTEFPHLGG